METITSILESISGVVWGPAMLVLLLGTGLYLTLGLRGMPIRRIGYGFRKSFWVDALRMRGDNPFQALATSLSATIGTGNIGGVATAIALGGPGAVFWMWMTALVGMATKYAEAVLAVKYREVDEDGRYVGGPMYYIKNGLGGHWKWLGTLFALFAMVAAFGIGNTVQANAVADVIETNMAVPAWLTGVVLAILVFLVIIGGIRRIAQVTEKLVPFMAVVYVVGALAIIIWNFTDVPGALAQIVTEAFSGSAATGGFAGAAVWAAIRFWCGTRHLLQRSRPWLSADRPCGSTHQQPGTPGYHRHDGHLHRHHHYLHHDRPGDCADRGLENRRVRRGPDLHGIQ